MRRDELNQPLHKRSLRQRLWERRPSALVCAYTLAIAGMIGGSTWVVRQPHPFAGEPIVVVAVPPPEQIKTASIEPVAEAPVQVEDIVATLDSLKNQGARLIDETPRVGAGGCLIAFVHPATAGGVLLELVQHSNAQSHGKEE